MGLADIGVRFGLPGIDQGIRQLDQLGSGFSKLQQTVDSAVGRMDARTKAISGSVHQMSQKIGSSLNLAKAAFGAFLTGKAIGGVADWMKGSPQMDAWKDFFRIQGAGDKEFKDYEAHLKGLRRRIAGVEKGDYMAGIYGMQSTFSVEDTDRNKKALESTLLMAKGMSPTTTIETAKNMMRTFASAFGAGKGEDETLALMQKFGAQVPELLKLSKAEAQDIVTAMSHVAGLYKQLGRTPAQMLADIGAVGGTMHERTGEFLKAVLSKEGIGFGKFAAAIGKEEQLARWGVRDEFALPKEKREGLKKSEEITRERASRFAGKLLADDPAAYDRLLKNFFERGKGLAKTRGFDLSHVMGEAFGETAMAGMEELVTKRSSGWTREIEKKLEASDAATQMHATERAQQSFSARYKIFTQRAEDLSATIKKPFQALGMELMKPYGEAIDSIESNWNQKTDLMSQNVIGFFRSASAGFSAAFGPLPSVDAMLKSIVETLGDPDPTKWAQLGEEFGRWAGTNLKPLTADIASIASSISTIAGLVPNLKTLWDWTGGWAVEGYRQYEKELLPKLAPDITGAEMRAEAALPFGLRRAPTASQNLAGPIALGPTGQWLVDAVRSAINAVMPTAAPQVAVESKPQITVRIGDREIKEVAVEAVREEMKADYAASRRGYGEGWGL